MDDILGLQNDPYRLADRHADVIVELLVVRCVELPVRTGIENFPVELLGGHLDDRIGGRHPDFDLLPFRLAGEPQSDKDQGWDHSPDEFQSGVAVGIGSPAAFPMAIHKEENHHQGRHQDEGRRGDVVDEVKERVDAWSVG